MMSRVSHRQKNSTTIVLDGQEIRVVQKNRANSTKMKNTKMRNTRTSSNQGGVRRSMTRQRTSHSQEKARYTLTAPDEHQWSSRYR